MKTFLVVFLALSAMGLPVLASSESGLEAYRAGDFSKAAREFETALASGDPSAGAYYNLGLAYRKSDQPARAALNFRRAILLDPRMADARMALSDVERAQGISLSPIDWRAWMAEHVALDIVLFAGFSTFWVGAFWILLLFARKRPGFLASSATILLCLLGAAVFLASYFSDPRFIYRSSSVALDPVTLLAAPAERSEKVARVPSGGVLEILRSSGDWDFCRLPDGTEGWASGAELVPLVPDRG